MKCIIYGLGLMRELAEKYLADTTEIIGYSDTFYSQSKFNKKDFFTPSQLKNINFDTIIVAVSDFIPRKQIISNLIAMGINETKILDFCLIYNARYNNAVLHDKLSDNSKYLLKKVNRVVKEECDGIILGISHAELGINPKFLSKKFYNLATSSQDIFYNLRNLQILINEHPDKIKNLNYVIFDLYKYCYFNYDVSLSKNAVKYFYWSGFRSDDSHNYTRNKNFTKSIEEELFNELNIDTSSLTPEKVNLFNKIFSIKNFLDDERNNISYSDFPTKDTRLKTLNSNDLKAFKNIYKPKSIQVKRFEDTINENINLLDTFFKTLLNINPNMKIYLVLIPQHKVVEDTEKKIEHNLKKDFYKIINQFKEVYNFKFLDFKNFEDISSRNDYYYDVQHLNYEGSKVFTKLLNSYIEY